MQNKIAVIGATGFIGEALAQFYLKKNYQMVGFTRNPNKVKEMEINGINPILWNGQSLNGLEKYLEGATAIINLAGENIASGRWSKKRKEIILNSRIKSAKAVMDSINKLEQKPHVYIQASAIGFYGNRQDEELDENSLAGTDFLSQVVQKWEASSNHVQDHEKVRRILCRFGMVLGKDKGALKKMMIPFRLFLGGGMGSGQQWMSWIHIDDLIRAIDFLINVRDDSEGVYNFTSPKPVRNREFVKCLGNVLHRPSFWRIPAFVLKVFLGEMAEQVLLSGQRVIPKKLLKEGFQFNFVHLEKALANLLKSEC